MNANGSGQLTVRAKCTDEAAAALSRCRRVTLQAVAELHAVLGWLPDRAPRIPPAVVPVGTGDPTLVLGACTWWAVLLADDDDATPLTVSTLRHDPDPDAPGAYVADAMVQAHAAHHAASWVADPGYVGVKVFGPDDRKRWECTLPLPEGWPW